MSDLTLAQQRTSVCRIGGLVLMNALIFQEVLAEHDGRVKPLQKLVSEENPIAAFSKQWDFILRNINYYPIFHVAREVLLSLPTNADIVASIEKLVQTAQEIVRHRAALRHDLMGRVYHRLLAEAKYLGTYYTSIPAATLLLKLALRQTDQIQWGNENVIAKFKIADLACGTGTLLMAAAEAVADVYIHERMKTDEDIDLSSLHRILAEDVLYGYDVLPSAIHLTASTLALRAPQITFRRMNLFCMPHGGKERRLGSIEFLDDQQVTDIQDLFGATTSAEQLTGKGHERLTHATIPLLDLCIMNPPFTRSVGGNLLFGSLPDADRAKMQKRLADLIKKKKVLANSTAGLGSVFVAIADRFIKQGGIIGLVLPKALLSGVAWDKTRELFRRKYRVEYIVSSHDPERWNFSENTSLSEVLLVAVKENGNSNNSDAPVVVLNLWRNPMTTFDALSTFYAVEREKPAIAEFAQSVDLTVGDSKIGEVVVVPWKTLRGRNSWMLPAAFAQSSLSEVAKELEQGRMKLPHKTKISRMKLIPTTNLGILGPDRRGIHTCFKQSKVITPFASLWGHDASTMNCLSLASNEYLSPRSKKQTASLSAEHLWQYASSCVFVERLRLNTQSLVSARLSKPVLSNVWWTFKFHKKKNFTQKEKVLVLWNNSTLGLLILLANREETEGAWIGFKKGSLEKMPILNIEELTEIQLKKLAAAYDKIAKKPLQPFPQMATDPVREEIDSAIADALHLPDFSILRKLLAQEPVVCLNRL